jgi:RNA polymerase sigma-54 factor
LFIFVAILIYNMLKQHLQQKLLQKLSPQQIQFIKLLQVPTVALDTRIKEELEENPALEDPSLMTQEEPKGEYDDLNDGPEEFEGPKEDNSMDEFNVDDYLQDDSTNDYSTNYNNGDDDEEKKETPIAIESTFFESLQEQLDLVPLSDQDFIIGKQIIGSLDDDGYLRRPLGSMIDDLAFSQNVIVEEEDVLEMLKLIQSFDPPGIGARDLKECLLIQLKRKDPNNPIIVKAMNVVENYLDEFTRKHYDKLEKSLGLDSEELKEVVNEILRLNPKPGDANQVTTKQMQIIPDFHISNNDGILILTLNSKNAPELKVSRSYQEMFEHYDKASSKDKKLKEAVQFVKQKLDSAKWFIDAIKQRQQTLLKTMNAIMHYQYEYFLTADERKMRPMILKDIADKIDMDISTVSRVANSKYVQTEFGTYLLKSFFSEAIQTENGEEVSNKEVKKILEDCIGNEDKRKPLADEKLTEILKERGYNIARRTVAKYREQMNIPVARLRKEL